MDKLDKLDGGVLSSVTENNNTGIRLSGYSDANYGNIGENAIDLSYSDIESTTRGATGENSLATGVRTTAYGVNSTAMGYFTKAMNWNTTASGSNSEAWGQVSTAMGEGTRASGYSSTTMGKHTTASGYISIAMGYDTTAGGEMSTAMGRLTKANGDMSTAMGKQTTASGYISTAMGYETTASDYGSFVIGQYNDALSSVTSNGSATAYNANNTAFVIGNGIAFDNKSDAFKVLFNGDATIGKDLTIKGKLIIDGKELSSDRMDKLDKLDGGILSSVTENNNTGFRLSAYSDTNYGDIGDKAIDLSHSDTESTTQGAMGKHSLATGFRTTASGRSSTAMGYETTASDHGSFVIGQYNDALSSVTSNGSATAYNANNTAFVIGNGIAFDNKSDAFKVAYNGDATIGKDLTIKGKLIIDGKELSSDRIDKLDKLDGGVLSSVTENNNTGFRLSAYSDTNYGDIGDKAIDLSHSVTESTTQGAMGKHSLATGLNTTASGERSTAMGESTKASGFISTAMGYKTTASGFMSTAMGVETAASRDFSTAMGYQTTASGYFSTASGKNSTASGRSSTAMGYETTASDHGSFVIGQYNDALSSVTTNGSATDYDPDNTAFVIGNGTARDNKSDAFKVLFNGDATVSNNLTVSGDVVISSDARLKANIVSLGSTLARLLLIDGKTFTMKKNGKQKIGVLAQNIQEVFPELVSKDDNEMLAVNYQGLVPVLINALKEQNAKMKKQDAKMKKQDAKMKKQDAKISRLEGLVKKLIEDK
jgi:predicted acyltransferase (DUF342 family)